MTNPADDLDGERVANLTSAAITASSGLSSTSVGGLWADGEVLWVVEDESDKLLSYRLDTASGRRHGGRWPPPTATRRGYGPAGDRVWVADHADDKVYAYDAAAGTAVPAEDISTLAAAGNNDPRGIWSDGTVMWVVDRGDRRVYAYLVGDGARVEDREVGARPRTTRTPTAPGPTGPRCGWRTAPTPSCTRTRWWEAPHADGARPRAGGRCAGPGMGRDPAGRGRRDGTVGQRGCGLGRRRPDRHGAGLPDPGRVGGAAVHSGPRPAGTPGTRSGRARWTRSPSK